MGRKMNLPKWPIRLFTIHAPTTTTANHHEQGSSSIITKKKTSKSPFLMAEDPSCCPTKSAPFCLTDSERTASTVATTPAAEVKAVRFSDCEIRSYPQILGDHPYCSAGCPLTLDWAYREEGRQELRDDDDAAACAETVVLSAAERLAILERNGRSSRAELRKASRRTSQQYVCSRKGRRMLAQSFFGEEDAAEVECACEQESSSTTRPEEDISS